MVPIGAPQPKTTLEAIRSEAYPVYASCKLWAFINLRASHNWRGKEFLLELRKIVCVHGMAIHPQWSSKSLLTNVSRRHGWHHDGGLDGTSEGLTYGNGSWCWRRCWWKCSAKVYFNRSLKCKFPLHWAVSQPLILPRDRLCSKLGQTFHHCYFTLHELFIGGGI